MTRHQMHVTLNDGWTATVTDTPLSPTPRLGIDSVVVGPYTDREERERFFFSATFGSMHFLWDTPDILRFDQDSRDLVAVELQLPYTSADAETTTRLPVLPEIRPGGLRADEAEDCHLEMCTALCRTPGDAELICLRDLDVLDTPLDARIGIAPDLTLLLKDGTVVGWTLTDPARHLTTGYAAPDPAPPAESTRRLYSDCVDLITQPLFDAITDSDPAALARLRAADEALRAQTEDRSRADALLELISNTVEDYGDWHDEPQ
ncbi:hypothetical protein [Streptomyces sp. SKN60]|uniref:hypothetical protein n=1 Tax=Streptomyces sp. SKN60 TaxID=2855506 RepID=UPI0022477189|nr:hypothetical protein [Streptomyces sp. SKN60]